MPHSDITVLYCGITDVNCDELMLHCATAALNHDTTIHCCAVTVLHCVIEGLHFAITR